MKSVEDMFVRDEALLEGHFKLRSGLHSAQYLQCAKVLEHPEHAGLLAAALAEKLAASEAAAVIGPATGGIILAYELARALSARALFAERENDVFTLRRGFKIAEGEIVVVAEDVITTGGAVKEVIELVRNMKGRVAAVAGLVNRSGGNPFDVPFHFLYSFEAQAWDPSQCPLCEKGIPVVKPGSRQEVS